jgi:hypothetical protein
MSTTRLAALLLTIGAIHTTLVAWATAHDATDASTRASATSLR